MQKNKIKIKKSRSCIACRKKGLIKYLDLGKSAPANSYLNKVDLNKAEIKFPLSVSYCPNCHLAQLTDWVDRKALFEYYGYFTRASQPLHEHFKKYAEDVFEKFPSQTKQYVFDIGSNDGFLLKCFEQFGTKILGVDPAKNIAKTANQNGIPTLPIFFGLNEAQKISKKYGKMGVVTANNVLAHTDDIHGILAGVKELLDGDGVFVFEVQYLADLIGKNEFDNTYHEHICYFSLSPLINLLQKWELQIFDVIKVNTQGGSLRVFASHNNGIHKIKKTVVKMIEEEKENGFHDSKLYKKFGLVPQKMKSDLLKMLADLKKQNKKIIGYGCAAKGNTMLQYCGIRQDLLDYIVDTTPYKQGKFTPGTHIPIMPPEYMKEERPDYILILAWNYAKEILVKESDLRKKGVKFIVPVPEIKII